MNKKTIRDINLTGQRVLVRVDFNVPLEGGVVSDETRIRESIPTLRYILEQKPRALILLSHLGRPKDGPDPKYSMRPTVSVLANYLGMEVAFAEDCVGEVAEAALSALPEGGVLILENTRFHKGEEKNDPALAAGMAKLGDVFVNDAFGTAHRAHASNVGLSSHLPAVAGFLMEKELNFLVNALEAPARPFMAIMGGAKISDKVLVIEKLLAKVDKLLIGGGMANTFLKAQGYELGASLVDEASLGLAADLLAKHGEKIVLPTDCTIADAFDNAAQRRTVAVTEGVPAGWQSLDIGPNSLAHYQAVLAEAKTIVWNGPLGVFELPNFAQGTFGIAQTLADLTAEGVVTIIGGGDSAAAVAEAGLADKMTHISTGGGASLELLEGKDLPGVVALADA
jgi:phosphoglycerate kinase